MKLLPWRVAIAALVLGVSELPASADSTFIVPSVSYVTATIPATFLSPETYLACLSHSEQAEPGIVTSLLCYSAQAPSLPPPPPPPPYDPPMRAVATGTLSGNVVVLPVVSCSVVAPNLLSVSLGALIPLSKDGGTASGWTVLVLDTAPPFDCADTVSYGALTMTPLAIDHDQDGDGCTDWKELDPAAPVNYDPFNPTDCGAGGNPVGGIAELPEVTGSPLQRSGVSGGSAVLASVAATAVAGGLALGGALWYVRRRRLRLGAGQ